MSQIFDERSMNIQSSPYVNLFRKMIAEILPVILVLASCGYYGFSQNNHSVSGVVKDAENNDPVVMATVSLLEKDSTLITGTTTDMDGGFELKNIQTGDYVIRVQYLGYGTYYEEIEVERSIQLSEIELREEAQTLEEVNISAYRSTGKQKGDTTQFDASAFATLPDASGHELVEKMPGIMVQDGVLQAQGEDVQKILIDGKPFFGDDVKLALESIPAEIIDNIQIYDKKSDKAELSGFDDGEEQRTINIVTKPNRKRGQFGRATGGYGTDNRYDAGASINFFNEDRRITVTGLSNNVNALTYSADPNNQDDARTQDGIIRTNNIGVQFSDEWNDKVEVSGSYQYSHRSNEGESNLFREYLLSSDSGQIYRQDNYQNKIQQDHRFHMRMEYTIDDRNKLIFIPRISLQNDDNHTGFEGETMIGNSLLNDTENDRTSLHQNNDYTARLIYNHKFGKKGRSFTLHSYGGYHTNTDLGNRSGVNRYYSSGHESMEHLLQESHLDRMGLTWNTRVSLTEPLGENGLMELEYGVSNRIDDSDKLMYEIIENPDLESERLLLDTSLSNTFDSWYLGQEIELGYQFKRENFSLQAELEYERVGFRNDQHFPAPFLTDRTVDAFLPSLRIDYKISESKNFEFNYFTWTNKPSIGQLQNVIDDSNPLQLRTGNPELNPSYNHRFRGRFKARNSDTDQSFYAGVSTSVIEDYVANETMIAQETMELENGSILEKGSQLIRPSNVQGYWNLWAYANYGQPLRFMKSNVNFWLSTGLTARPGVINDEKTLSNSRGYRGGVSLSSNISDRIDFNISTRSSFNQVDNSLRPQLNTEYFNQRTRIRYNWVFWNGFVYRTDISHRLDTGLADGYNNSVFLVNMSFGKKILANQLGEINVKVYDLFGQNNNVRRNVSEIYIEDWRNTVLQQYFMMSFTYNIRNFSKGTSIEDFDI